MMVSDHNGNAPHGGDGGTGGTPEGGGGQGGGLVANGGGFGGGQAAPGGGGVNVVIGGGGAGIGAGVAVQATPPAFIGSPNPVLTVDPHGFLRFPEPEMSHRHQHVVNNGLPAILEVTLWEPLNPSAPLEDGLWVILFHEMAGWTQFSANPETAPWGHHVSLLRPREIIGALSQDPHDVIDAIDGVVHVTQVAQVNERHSVFISPTDPIFSGVWQQLHRLRAAGGHAGAITISA